jgi:hypothetical protein
MTKWHLDDFEGIITTQHGNNINAGHSIENKTGFHVRVLHIIHVHLGNADLVHMVPMLWIPLAVSKALLCIVAMNATTSPTFIERCLIYTTSPSTNRVLSVCDKLYVIVFN